MKNTYPRPQFEREMWLNLNGKWDFTFDDSDQGLKDKWYKKPIKDLTINVPFCYQSKDSGIFSNEDHSIMWYQRTFKVEKEDTIKILNVGAIDYRSDIFINGELVRTNLGGNVSFTVDITNYVNVSKENVITIRVFDDMKDIEIPRGKQYWKEESENIFYTRTSGIWQSIWLEEVPKTYIKRTKFIPDILTNSIKIGYYFENLEEDSELETEISFNGKTVIATKVNIHANYYEAVYYLGKANDQDKNHFWSPENPNLYDVTFTLTSSKGIDQVKSYFGMRKISIENGNIMLNNRPYYLRLVLDQGYYPTSLLTAPNDEAMKQDINLTKLMGFNGVRKHQKIEEERYLYYADKMGLIVWEEMPSAYKFSSKSMMNLLDEWQRAIKRDYNHPSIVAWVPINESWGVPNLLNSPREVHFLESMYHLTKALDDTRMVISNDGWEHGTTDLLTIHDYESKEAVLEDRYHNLETILNSLPGHRILLNKGFTYNKQPILVTEFGGISFEKSSTKGWGYSSAKDPKDFEKRLSHVFKPLYKSPFIQGVCYTQLTDVEQEINGLLTYEREPKIPLEIIRSIVLNQN
ncbi:MAG: glycoside hydrolase family 2 protein [Candidatus Izemoplasmataceae bacterium]|uniref:glycoside hydrolase family 2 protein n=1 Tax=Liberiplasma polymorphum TaxID=3374570 RepID=UPI003774AFBF